jgi:hypothetical protein
MRSSTAHTDHEAHAEAEQRVTLREPVPWVLLRHDTEDGAHHFDLMIARRPDTRDPDERALVTFRLDRALRDQPRSFRADRIADHRAVYLTREGPIGGGRGSVARIEAGTARWLTRSDDALVVDLDWGDGPCRLEGARRSIADGSDGDCWIFARQEG